MTLHVSHFDTKLRQDLQVEEPVKNSMAEYLFPDAKFAIGELNPKTVQVEDLAKYEDMNLELASGERMYFANQPVRDEVFPLSFRWGSLR